MLQTNRPLALQALLLLLLAVGLAARRAGAAPPPTTAAVGQTPGQQRAAGSGGAASPVAPPATPPTETPGTSTTLAISLATTAPTTPSPFQLATKMPPLDVNLELLDYPLALLEELQLKMAGAEELKAAVGRHHSNEELYEYLKQLAAAYPAVTRLYSVGESVEGRKLWVLEISERPGEHELLKPEFRYIANMHGNEVVGRELLLHLARLLLETYHAPDHANANANGTLAAPPRSSNATASTSGGGGGGVANDDEEALKPTGAKFVRKLLRSTRIHLMPSMNPDGYARSSVACKFEEPSRRGRVNANNVDLNRNFPDEALGTRLDAGTQPEVRAVIEWSLSEPFVLAANLHGGALVANFPYDSSTSRTLARDFTRRAPDHELLRALAESYARAHPTMWTGAMCYDKCTDYHGETFEESAGTTTGAAWYALHGGMQDWMYNHTNELHLTLELGCNQFPPAEALLQYWDMNKGALLNYMRQVHRGIKGTIQDAQTGAYLANVLVHVVGNEHNVSSSKFGDYFRLLPNGTHLIHFEHPLYQPEKLHVQLGNGMAQVHNVKLRAREAGQRGPPTASTSTSTTTTTQAGEAGAQEALTNANGLNESDHSIVVATLVMSVLTIMLLLAIVGAYLIQKQRYRRSQSVSVELQPARSSGTGVSLPRQGAGALHLSASTINTDVST